MQLLSLWRWLGFRYFREQYLNLVFLLPVLPQLVEIDNRAHYLLHFVQVDVQLSEPLLGGILLQDDACDLQAGNGNLKFIAA